MDLVNRVLDADKLRRAERRRLGRQIPAPVEPPPAPGDLFERTMLAAIELTADLRWCAGRRGGAALRPPVARGRGQRAVDAARRRRRRGGVARLQKSLGYLQPAVPR